MRMFIVLSARRHRDFPVPLLNINRKEVVGISLQNQFYHIAKNDKINIDNGIIESYNRIVSKYAYTPISQKELMIYEKAELC